MAPPTYAKTCAACHGLQFDKRFTEGAPHDTPEVIHAFLDQRFRQYIFAHPDEVRETRARARFAAEAAAGCGARPHAAAVGGRARGRIRAAALRQNLQAVPCTEFCAHRPRCPWWRNRTSRRAGCRTRISITTATRWSPARNATPRSSSRETSDILLPGIATCEKCHHSGSDGVEARCFECHTYHDWTKAKAVKGKITLTGLGGSD